MCGGKRAGGRERECLQERVRVCESASLYVGGGKCVCVGGVYMRVSPSVWGSECVCVSGGCGVYMCVSLSLCVGVYV